MINNKSFDLERVYTENREKFIGFALGYSVSKDTAIDIYQDAVVALMEQIKKNKPIAVKSSVATYLFAIGKYMLFHYLKKEKRLTVEIEDLPEIEWDFMEAAQKEEQIGLLQLYYEKMGEHCKKILQLFYYEEKKLEEIVHLLGYENKDVVKSQKSRCIKQLKTLIAEHNG